MAASGTISTRIVRLLARDLKNLRKQAISVLYPLTPAGPPDALTDLANTFSRYASTQQTAYDNGSARASSAGGTSILERQAERAIAQVLGRTPGRDADSFMSALTGAFPAGGNGQVTFTPSRSAVSMYGQNGSAPSAAAGLTGQLSAEQANLFRQGQIVAGDALKVLDSLQPYAPEAETDQVEALRSLIRAEISTILDEFGRPDEPRGARVEIYFNALIGVDGHVPKLGRRALLDGSIPPVSVSDESQLAGFRLLRTYIDVLQDAWNAYKSPSASLAYPLFSDRLARASILVPVIAGGNNNFMSAMDSIGFTDAERQSTATRFTQLKDIAPAPLPGFPVLEPPDMTVGDLTDWLDRFASTESPSNLSDSGQYGLEFVASQADKLFWVFVSILGYTKTVTTLNMNGVPLVAQVLLHERVSWTLDDLINQLRALADLAA